MPDLNNYHIFISHAWKYGKDYDRLVRMLDSAPNFSYWNYSAPEYKPLKNLEGGDVSDRKQIAEAIQRKIAPCNCVLVISGMYYDYREWMQYEVDVARYYQKPIIAVRPWGNVRMPYEISALSDMEVGWNTASIVDAIRALSI